MSIFCFVPVNIKPLEFPGDTSGKGPGSAGDVREHGFDLSWKILEEGMATRCIILAWNPMDRGA